LFRLKLSRLSAERTDCGKLFHCTLSGLFRQLLSARKCTISYRIVSYFNRYVICSGMAFTQCD